MFFSAISQLLPCVFWEAVMKLFPITFQVLMKSCPTSHRNLSFFIIPAAYKTTKLKSTMSSSTTENPTTDLRHLAPLVLLSSFLVCEIRIGNDLIPLAILPPLLYICIKMSKSKSISIYLYQSNQPGFGLDFYCFVCV